ncbi:zinc-ribbon domain-containing protein [Streptomyces cinnamoneus]|uniref:zinc-ribbon domain-containing protein n=1 Tax=Streptomyces cinnamoneus TaxID=53446 RepID=UPI003412ACB3
MSDVPIPLTDQAVSFPRPRNDLPEEDALEERRVAVEWLRGQERALAEVFLREGRQELPVDGFYTDWRQAQQRRLGEARARWLEALAEAGWAMGAGARSLAYLRPDLLDDYDQSHEENPVTLLFTGSVTASESVWWRCFRDESHQWKTSIDNRHVVGTGCPRCVNKGVSRREQEVFTSLRKYLPALVSPGTVARHASPGPGPGPGPGRLRSWRVDMLLPGNPPVAVEYDGAYWHQDALQRDQDKAADLTASGHVVIRIREQPLSTITRNDVVCTPDQPAETVAELVYRKIQHLTAAACEPRDGLDTDEGMQLELFSDATTETASSGNRNAAESFTFRILIKEALLQTLTAGVNSDRTLGERLACGLPLEHACMQLQQDMGGIRSLVLAAQRLFD